MLLHFTPQENNKTTKGTLPISEKKETKLII